MEISTQTTITGDEQDKLTFMALIDHEATHPHIQIEQLQPAQHEAVLPQQHHHPHHHQQQQPLPTKLSVNEESFCDPMTDDEDDKYRTRKRNPDNWKQNVRKRNKNKGLEYIKANGEVCEQKKMGPPCTCKEKCYLKIGKETCHKIFNSFWKLGDHSLQNAYIAGCVRIFLPKNCYKKDGGPSRRFYSRNFHVTVNGVDTEICKQAFLNIHSISNGRLDRLLKKKQVVGNTGFDERGRHGNKVNKIPAESIKFVRQHIQTYRKRAGYLGRRKPKKVELLSGKLNVRSMYRSYREQMDAKKIEPVCEYRYRRIFHSDFNLDFGKPGDVSPEVKRCNKTNAKKPDVMANTTLQTMNVDINEAAKIEKPMETYVEVDTRNIHPKVQDTAYVELTQVFRPDYAISVAYNPNQQNWIFPNQI